MSDHAENLMRKALELFQIDPPDSDFQLGYLEALKVFANEGMGFKWDDPLLWGEVKPAAEVRQKPKLTLIVSSDCNPATDKTGA